MMLMCKNNQVYDITSEKVINSALLPGLMQKHPCNETFKKWLKLRYSSNTNTLARKLQGVTFGQGNRITIDKATYALSLSDSYWLSDNIHISFESISPYFNNFWTGIGDYISGTIPTLYVNGYLNKAWLNSTTLYKSENIIEIECSRLAKLCNIPCAEVIACDTGGILIKNITSPDIMLEQADMSGKIDPDEFTDIDILNTFSIHGFDMLALDAIVGNGDRHAGNFGFMRDTNTGDYISMAPLYDFDHAKDSIKCPDRLLKDILSHKEYHLRLSNIARVIYNNTIDETFKNRSQYILQQII